MIKIGEDLVTLYIEKHHIPLLYVELEYILNSGFDHPCDAIAKCPILCQLRTLIGGTDE